MSSYTDIVKYWNTAEIVVIDFKGIECSILGGNIVEIQEKLENDLFALTQMNA